MQKIIKISKSVLFQRIFIYSAVLLACAGLSYFGWTKYQANLSVIKSGQTRASRYDEILKLTSSYTTLSNKINEAVAKYTTIDLKDELISLATIKQNLIDENIDEARNLLNSVGNSVATKITVAQKLADEEASKGNVLGTVTFSGNPVANAKVQLVRDGNTLEATTDNAGRFALRTNAGKCTVKFPAGEYSAQEKEVDIVAGQDFTLDFALKKPTPTSRTTTPTSKAPVTEESSGDFKKTTVSTDRGDFTVRYMAFNLSEVRMVVDTANDEDCKTDCSVKSLKSFVTANEGFAGIHGTYFCPTSYADCANETNSYYYKLYNGRLDQKINWTNGIGDYLPFLMIDKSGTAKYFNSWSDAKDLEMSTGISCRPNLVSGGKVVVTDADLDSDKERTSKINHGFIGVTGQTIYAGIVSSATVLDEAAAVQALGIENALNIDGGGTSAMYYNGSYMVGPGRDMPNAIVFVKK